MYTLFVAAAKKDVKSEDFQKGPKHIQKIIDNARQGKKHEDKQHEQQANKNNEDEPKTNISLGR